MKLLIFLFAMLAFLTNQSIASAEADPNAVPEAMPEADHEAGVLEPSVCVKIRVCHDYNFKGGCYSECRGPGSVHPIKKAWQHNAGSFAVDTKGYSCTIGLVGDNGNSQGTCAGRTSPGYKKLPDYCVNNIKGYQCNFV